MKLRVQDFYRYEVFSMSDSEEKTKIYDEEEKIIKKEFAEEEKEIKETHHQDEDFLVKKHREEEKELREKHNIEERKLHEKHRTESEKLVAKHVKEKNNPSAVAAAHHTRHTQKNLFAKLAKNTDFLFIAGIIAIIILAIAFKPFLFPAKEQAGNEYGTVDLEFYVMSQCPYGVQVEDAIAPVLEKIGDSVNFSLHFIGRIDGDKFDSLHGEPEVLGNKVQLCAAKYNSDEYMDLIICMNKDMRAIPNNWKKCAEDANLNVAAIETCYDGEEGDALLKESFQISDSKKATGSPTIYLAGELYNSGRDSLSFQRVLCQHLEGHPECNDIPACGSDADCKKTGKVGACLSPGQQNATCVYSDPMSVGLIILTDKRCGASCDVSRTLVSLSELFPGINTTTIDYSTEEGKQLFRDNQLSALPALLFDKGVAQDPSYASVSRYFAAKGEYLSLNVGASFDPTKEICDNGIDDTGNGKIDCEDDECAGVWQCVKKTDQPIVELFVMSHCPYGTQIMKGMLPVAELLGDKIDFQLKFVNYAMHGQKEIDEQLKMECISKEYSAKLLPYLKCFLNSTSGSLQESEVCMEKLGIVKDKITYCMQETDKQFGISVDYQDKSTWRGNYPSFALHDAENVKYGVRGSPDLRINGANPSTGRDAVSLLKAVCSAFTSKPAECDDNLASHGSPTPGFGLQTASAGTATTTASCD
jgi:hypothetical protein